MIDYAMKKCFLSLISVLFSVSFDLYCSLVTRLCILPKRQIDVFGSKFFCRIMGYCWNDFVSNQQLLCGTESRYITSIVCQHHLWLYAHVAHYPEADPTCRIVSERYYLKWGRPQGSWLGQVDASCRELLGMGREPAWKLTQGHWKVKGEAMRSSEYAPNDWLIDLKL